MTGFSHALTPLQFGTVELRNRIVMGSMHTGLEDKAKDIPALAAYFAERARGGVGLIVTGGYSPNTRGWLKPLAGTMSRPSHAERHKPVTEAVHEAGGAIALQILHAGRYGYTPFSVGASRIKSPITPFRPSTLSTKGVDETATDFARAAALAQRAGYDGVEIMGSEGYLINQFLAMHTNNRTDRWGGTAENRMRFPLEVVRRTRELVGDDFGVMYRISLLDLVPNGQTWEETTALARELEVAGVTVLNTGIGWHEARVPTILTQVPRNAWVSLTARLKAEVSVPVCASNRINTMEAAEDIIASGSADLVSMARPFLADPDLVAKAAQGRTDEINTCIACNQACLDRTFSNLKASCLVNPRACNETTLVLSPTKRKATVAVVGAGPAGLSAAVAAAERGLGVTLFEASDQIGGQFLLARQIPGKEEFAETLRYFTRRLEVLGVDVRLNTRVEPDDLADFDEVVIATGVEPRLPTIPGAGEPGTVPVVSYAEVLRREVIPGKRVAVVGAGGIGVDMSVFLTETRPDTADVELKEWLGHWGVGDPAEARGGLVPAVPRHPDREVWLLQRKTSPIGKGLGKTSGWAHRAVLRQMGVHLLTGVSYERVSEHGLHITVDGTPQLLEVDTIILCAGQESVRVVYDGLVEGSGASVHLIGGADVASELDARRAIQQGTLVAAAL